MEEIRAHSALGQTLAWSPSHWSVCDLAAVLYPPSLGLPFLTG